ncbi:choice-of-anchor U domain-containing protein [Verminephrobacter aporrectodeae]|uniref:choice-of-anchor U domain-containing protein n=1 Tax=Verminephrobacter aporrectodeae TaxID=1110389 RepID=UPI002237BF04|nr:choice-of-anchor U domain-containing protein [Verminephrobacter aporrectodeae]
METPLGLLRFEATLAPSHSSEAFSLYVDPALDVNGYWPGQRGHWVNLSSAPYGAKWRTRAGGALDFEIADGGPFDADGQANGAITAPGAAARMPLSLVGRRRMRRATSGSDGAASRRLAQRLPKPIRAAWGCSKSALRITPV